jgi:predicted CDP-diglyceride synthetase/phosphatidate cytidylyltransferase
MSDIAGTMPEAKFRTTKKKVQPVRAAQTSQRMQVSVVEGPPLPALKENVAAKPQKASLGEQIASWWPVAVAIFLSGFVPEWHAMAAQAGIWALRLTFPLSLLATHREIGIDAQMAAILPQAALYLQLPLEGLLTKITLDRGRSLKAAIAQLFLIHGVATLVLWLVTFGSK